MKLYISLLIFGLFLGMRMDLIAADRYNAKASNCLSFFDEPAKQSSAAVSQSKLSELFPGDKTVKIAGVQLETASLAHPGQDIELAIDGRVDTHFHTLWSGIPRNEPVVIDIALAPEKGQGVDYMILTPRLDGVNGIIRSASVSYKTVGAEAFTRIKKVTSQGSNLPLLIDMPKTLYDVELIRISVDDAYSSDPETYYVSLAQVECFERVTNATYEADLKYFTDKSCSELKPGVKKRHLSRINNPYLKQIAEDLYEGVYAVNNRVKSYEAYSTVQTLAQELKTSLYSQFENPTGIYFKEGESVLIFVDDTYGQNIQLRVRDFGPGGQDNTYFLSSGVNVLEMKGSGNGYLIYYSDNFALLPQVKVHIASGSLNPVFDVRHHSNSDGRVLLDGAVGGIIDLVGERVQLAYSVASLKKYSYDRLADLVNIYDSIVSSQHTLMGLEKYNRLPKNRMFGRVIWRGFMHADGIGAAFHDNTMSQIADPDKLIHSIWGPAHEFGHVNQVRPGMSWVGTTEVTNNIYSAWIQYCFTPDNLRLEHENIGGEIGGRFNAYLNNALIKNQEWGLQSGPDAQYGERNGKWGGDHFVKLVPLWQLHLFFHLAGEGNDWHRPFFWADIFETVRNTEEQELSHGELQMNWIKNMCDAVQYDLSGFFERIGMLQEVDKLFDDYTSRQKTITREMIAEVKDYVSKYPELPYKTLAYISANSLEAYKYQRQLEGDYGKGCIINDDSVEIDHSVWRNVTVFEIWQGEELIKITMAGTGSRNPVSSTKVLFPDNASRIEAVGFDGERKLVYGYR